MEHGRNGYSGSKCRCGVCRADWAAYIREYRKTKPKDYWNAFNRAWRTANPEKVRAQKRRWYATEGGRDYNRRCANRRRGATVQSYRRMDIYRRDVGVCWLCFLPVPKGEFQIDHVVPISLGGLDSPENVRIAHGACNSKRGAQLVGPGHLV